MIMNKNRLKALFIIIYVSWKLYHLSKKDACTARSLREKVDYTLLAKKILDIKLDKDNFYISSYWKLCSE